MMKCFENSLFLFPFVFIGNKYIRNVNTLLTFFCVFFFDLSQTEEKNKTEFCKTRLCVCVCVGL